MINLSELIRYFLFEINFFFLLRCSIFTEPMTEDQQTTLRKLCPILLQELHTKHPSKLCHFLVGRGTMTWQDVVVVEHLRQTDLERNR